MTSSVHRGGRDLVRDVQRFGLFSAALVVDRYTEIVDRTIAGDPLLPGVDLPDGQQAVLGLVDAVTAVLRTGAPPDPPGGTLVLPPASAGTSSEFALWVHNTTSATVPVVELHGTDLVSSSGHRIAADGVELVPERVDTLAAGGSREVRLRVSVPPGQPAGLYHGLVLNSAASADPTAVRLEVRGP